MRIAVIGTGSVGRALGTRLAEAGHQVIFGSRTPTAGRVEQLVAAAGHGVSAIRPDAAAAASDVVVLATPWPGTHASVRSLGSLTGKILVDCTNPLLPDLAGLDIRGGVSGAQRVAEWAGDARVVKAFNTTGARNMANPHYDEHRLFLPLCGDDAKARGVVAGLAREVGFEPVDCGDLGAAILLEHLAMLWIRLAHGEGLGANIGFALLRREE